MWVHYSCRSLTSMAVSIPGEFSESLVLLNSSLLPNENIFPDTTQAYVWPWSAAMSMPHFSHQVMSPAISEWPKPGEFAFWTVEFHPTAASPTLVITLISLCDISTCFEHLPPLYDQMFVNLYDPLAASPRGTVRMEYHHPSHPLPPSDPAQLTAKTVFCCKIKISQKLKPVMATFGFPWRI